jgi:hypothetical protein
VAGASNGWISTLVRQLQVALDGKSKKSGTVICTWPGGSQLTNVPTVTHGLGKTPQTVQLTVMSTPVVSVWTWANAVGATTFILAVQTSSAAPAGGTQCTVAWEVTG